MTDLTVIRSSREEITKGTVQDEDQPQKNVLWNQLICHERTVKNDA
jgi:hypothetical protein